MTWQELINHFTALMSSWSWSCEIMYHAFPTFLHDKKLVNNSYSFQQVYTLLPTNSNCLHGVVRDETRKYSSTHHFKPNDKYLNRWLPPIHTYKSYFGLLTCLYMYVHWLVLICHCPHLTTCIMAGQTWKFCESNTWSPLSYLNLKTCPLWKVQTDPDLPYS